MNYNPHRPAEPRELPEGASPFQQQMWSQQWARVRAFDLVEAARVRKEEARLRALAPAAPVEAAPVEADPTE